MIKLPVLFALALSTLWAQRVTDRRTADIRGGGGDGKCTIEVVVDDVAEVEIMGRNATIRTLSGGPATFRRFVCNQEMPMNPYQFRFEGVDGRGRQNLVRSAENGGRAIIRIEDNRGGSEGYTFDIFWRGGSGGGGYVNPGIGGGGYNNPGGGQGGWNNGWGTGSGWIRNGSFNFEGGGRGSYRDRDGRRRRLDDVRVQIRDNGVVLVEFQTERGRLEFGGPVERRDGRRVYARVSGSGMNGVMEMEMGGHNRVNRIRVDDIDLNWSN